MDGLFRFRLKPVPLASDLGPMEVARSREDPEADPRPEDCDDLELTVDRSGGDSEAAINA
jgi:hypothetical protein